MKNIVRFQVNNRVKVGKVSMTGLNRSGFETRSYRSRSSSGTTRRRISIIRTAFLASFAVWIYFYMPQLFQRNVDIERRSFSSSSSFSSSGSYNFSENHNIKGQKPVALVKVEPSGSQKFALLDMNGVVVGFEDSQESQPDLVLIIVDNIGNVGNLFLGARLDLEALRVALEVIQLGNLLGMDISKEIFAIKADNSKISNKSNSNKIVLLLRDDSEAWLSRDYLESGFRDLLIVLKYRGSRGAGKAGGYLDARFKGAVYQGYQGGG